MESIIPVSLVTSASWIVVVFGARVMVITACETVVFEKLEKRAEGKADKVTNGPLDRPVDKPLDGPVDESTDELTIDAIVALREEPTDKP
jgi:hypothetical protein